MAAKKKMPKKKGARKPKPEMLGTGLAYKAGKALKNRKAQIECQTNGGRWVNGKCIY